MDLKSLWNDALVGGQVSVHSDGLNGSFRSSYVRKKQSPGYARHDGAPVGGRTGRCSIPEQLSDDSRDGYCCQENKIHPMPTVRTNSRLNTKATTSPANAAGGAPVEKRIAGTTRLANQVEECAGTRYIRAAECVIF